MSVSLAQLKAMISFMEQHKDLALGRCSRSKEGRSLAKRLWAQCAQVLNSISPDCQTRSADSWRCFYNEYKSKIIRKIKKQKAEQQATGGGLATHVTLTPFQERLYTILGRDVGEPLEGVRHNPLSDRDVNQEQEQELPFALYQDLPILFLDAEDRNEQEEVYAPMELASSVDYDSIVEPTIPDYQSMLALQPNTTSTPTIATAQEPQHMLSHIVEPTTSQATTQDTISPIQNGPLPATISAREPQRRRRNRLRLEGSSQQHHGTNSNLEEAQRTIAELESQSARAILQQAHATSELATAVSRLATALSQPIRIEIKSRTPMRKRARIILSSDSDSN